ncbi:MAG: hypothetical protein KAS47_02915 [Candidatus Heimdallarchaeota archaeon]|nr:hypothetical protein [Candidatus Heimdallarchaeota archaeon]
MNKTKISPKQRETDRIQTILKLSVTAAIASLGIILSAFVIFFPNIEFISVTIFLIALLFGLEYGLLAAISIAIVYEFLVIPIYGSGGLLILFKLLCYIGLAIVAGLGRKLFVKLSFWELGVFGATFALIYDVITTLFGQIIVLQQSVTATYLISLLIWGIPFTLSHVIGNFILFSLTKTLINWVVAAFKFRGIKLLMLPQLSDSSENVQTDNVKGDIS